MGLFQGFNQALEDATRVRWRFVSFCNQFLALSVGLSWVLTKCLGLLQDRTCVSYKV